MLLIFGLTCLALFTSAIAGILGFGGGMLLIAIMPAFLPANAIIPVHGIVQLASNGSRVLFSLKDVEWRLLPPFLAGSVIGLAFFGYFLYSIPAQYIPVAIGAYILLSLWSEHFNQFLKRYESFYAVGAMQSGLSLIVGATGPLATSILTRHLQNKDKIIATGAIFMAISHLAKILIFGLIGFSFSEFIWLILLMSAGAIAGSYLGTQFRQQINNQTYLNIVKAILSILAIRMIWLSIME